MRNPSTCRGMVTLLLAAMLGVGCGGGGAGPAVPSSAGATPAPLVESSPGPTEAPAPAATLAIVATTRDVVYESADPRLPDGLLDVYTPTEPGSYPVVVMLHGGPGVVSKGWIAPWAEKVAEQGYVVFAPAWGVVGTEATGLSEDMKIELQVRQAACAVAYARTHAADYGGDPATVVVFGHSAGANAGSVIAFGGAQPVDGCPGGDTAGPVSSLVTYEGDWLLMDTMWGPSVPNEVAAATPWNWLASDTRLPVVMLVSEGMGGLVDPPALDPPVDWATARDPAALRERLVTAGADGGRLDAAQEQAILAAALKAQGNPVTLTEIPGADHMSVGRSGMPLLLAAIARAAGREAAEE
jgi:acetyl esterase/lipase